MKNIVILCVFLAGCAIGHVGPDGALTGFAIGHAKVQHCIGNACDAVSGGALSASFSEFLSNLVTAVVAYFTAGAA